MHQEDIQIITGTPEEVATKVSSYLESHSAAKIFSSAICFKPGEPIKPAPVAEEANETPSGKPKKAAKKNAANAEGQGEGTSEGAGTGEGEGEGTGAAENQPAEPAIAAELTAIEYGPPTPFMTVIVGKEWA